VVVNETTREVLYTPPPPHDDPILMAEFVDWLNSTVLEVYAKAALELMVPRVVDLGPVYEYHQVGVLLDGARFAQVFRHHQYPM